MRTIYLIRHGIPTFEDNQKRYIGQTDLPLSQAGKDQMLRVKASLSDKNIQEVYSSPLIRCLASARLIAGCNLPVICRDGLKEINMGIWENRTFADIRSCCKEAFQQRGRDLSHFRPDQGETFVECLERARITLEEIVLESSGNIAIVSHAGLIRAFLCWVQGRDLNALFDIPQPYGCINVLQAEAGRFSFIEIILNPA